MLQHFRGLIMPEWIIVLIFGVIFASLGGLCIDSTLCNINTSEKESEFSGTPMERASLVVGPTIVTIVGIVMILSSLHSRFKIFSFVTVKIMAMCNNAGIQFKDVVGVALILIACVIQGVSIVARKRALQRCTVELEATIIGFDSHSGSDGHGMVCCPTYHAYYNGNDLILCNNVYDNRHYRVGATRRVRINPECPKDFTDYTSVVDIYTLFFSLLLAISGVLALLAGRVY